MVNYFDRQKLKQVYFKSLSSDHCCFLSMNFSVTYLKSGLSNLNAMMSQYKVSLRHNFEYGHFEYRITSNTDTFNAVTIVVRTFAKSINSRGNLYHYA